MSGEKHSIGDFTLAAELTIGNPQLLTFADLGSGEIKGITGKNIIGHLQKLSQADATRRNVQIAVSDITREILMVACDPNSSKTVLLAPVLRSGLAMWSEANSFFNNSETSFLMGHKEKGTNQVTITWTKRNDLENKLLIFLDPIIATGDTLIKAYESVVGASSIYDQPSVTIIACYAAPEGVSAILKRINNVNLIVGCMAEKVDDSGYLVPPTNGDMGDKLFGSTIITV